MKNEYIIGADCKKSFIYLFDENENFNKNMKHLLSNAFDISFTYESSSFGERNLNGEFLFLGPQKYNIKITGKGNCLLNFGNVKFVSSSIIDLASSSREVLFSCFFESIEKMPLLNDFLDNKKDKKDNFLFVPILNCCVVSKKINNNGWSLELVEK